MLYSGGGWQSRQSGKDVVCWSETGSMGRTGDRDPDQATVTLQPHQPSPFEAKQ